MPSYSLACPQAFVYGAKADYSFVNVLAVPASLGAHNT